jgi:hypothetical protein
MKKSILVIILCLVALTLTLSPAAMAQGPDGEEYTV